MAMPRPRNKRTILRVTWVGPVQSKQIDQGQQERVSLYSHQWTCYLQIFVSCGLNILFSQNHSFTLQIHHSIFPFPLCSYDMKSPLISNYHFAFVYLLWRFSATPKRRCFSHLSWPFGLEVIPCNKAGLWLAKRKWDKPEQMFLRHNVRPRMENARCYPDW